jgi:hypothetical protein
MYLIRNSETNGRKTQKNNRKYANKWSRLGDRHKFVVGASQSLSYGVFSRLCVKCCREITIK